MNNLKNFKQFNESNNNEIHTLISMIEDNITSGWKGEELEESYDCVALQNANMDLKLESDESNDDGVRYNGWNEKLEELINNGYPQLESIRDKMNHCHDDLWEHDLENTFSCVVLEDVDITPEIPENDDSWNDYSPTLYNGWFEDLKNLV